MTFDDGLFEQEAADAVRFFWNSRNSAMTRQAENGRIDQGGRSGVTAGKNMDYFAKLLHDVVKHSGMIGAEIFSTKGKVTLPGFLGQSKDWDLVVIWQNQLVAAIELKSQVGPAFGNNFNNRTEEAIGTAHDFWLAVKHNAIETHPELFVGWLILVEDAAGSRKPGIRELTKPFASLPEFRKASYLQRYEIFCKKLVAEALYTQTAILASTHTGGMTGDYSDMSPETSFKNFVMDFASRMANIAQAQKSN
jgi:hypothetical protein